MTKECPLCRGEYPDFMFFPNPNDDRVIRQVCIYCFEHEAKIRVMQDAARHSWSDLVSLGKQVLEAKQKVALAREQLTKKAGV